MMQDYEIAKFKLNNKSIDVRISVFERTVWLTQEEISILFNRNQAVISRHINNIFNEGDLDRGTSMQKMHKSTDVETLSYRPPTCYNLNVIIAIGYRIKSKSGLLLKEFLDRYLSDYYKNQKNLEGNTIIYNNGDVSLPVNISPEEETVWLNVNQIAELFDTSTHNIYSHINNIYEDGEIDISVVKDSLITQKEIAYKSSDGKIYQTLFYNLDVILAVGYRVKSSKAIMFRRWANSVLKEYLLKGYVINEKRALVTNENYINLINRVDNIDNRVSRLESSDNLEKEKIFFDGEYFDARSFIKGLILKANKSVILIDPYSDIKTLDYFKYITKNVPIILCLSHKSRLTNFDIESFIKQYGHLQIINDDSFHDRFLLIDEKHLYHLGTSINNAGSKTFAITKMEDEKIIKMILERIYN